MVHITPIRILYCLNNSVLFNTTGRRTFFFAQWTAVACVGALIDDSFWQFLIFGAIHAASFVVLVVLRPFANK